MVNIKPSSQNRALLDMSNVIKVDGDYIIEIKTKGQNKLKHYGYYTNGWPCEEKIDIYVTNDTIRYKPTLNDY
jgi:hypothetical protein